MEQFLDSFLQDRAGTVFVPVRTCGIFLRILLPSWSPVFGQSRFFPGFCFSECLNAPGSPSGCRSSSSLQSGSREQQLERRSISMSDFWHKMGCCVVAKPTPKKKRRKIDRTMIGEPTNFLHLTHIGSGEMTEGLQPSGSVQEQMRSKGRNMNSRDSLL